MNFSMKKWAAAMTVALVLGAAVCAQDDAAFAKVGEVFIETLPNLAARQNVEPRSWIGYLWAPKAKAAEAESTEAPTEEVAARRVLTTFHERPEGKGPHFTVGATIGAAKFDLDKISEAMSENDEEADTGSMPSIPLPLIAGDLRLGGVVLPFDLGFSFMTLDLGSLLGDGFLLKYTNFGVDARYLIIAAQGKIPNISVGLGYNHIAMEAGFSGSESDEEADATYGVAMDLKSDSFFVSAQTDKTWRFASVFGGVKVLFDTTKVKGGFDVSVKEATTGEVDGTSNISEVVGELKVRPLVHGGVSWRLGSIETVLGASIDLSSMVWGGSYSFRVRI
jgi:hypothetical protein